ncbi:arylamine N-acetyltransferase [Bacillus sp. V3-13]|uniref:arylamine N-acetyltransferase n=1 Tax=Bacillus sp. V3-13 TaxID=2053728 RepID=UPI000C765A41|nr:arylamine N-acetyltransferase [Bacillus sp. V3-13]PLR75324.1 arylamine N-acetyltransferase [Bacillus sp. V3-13]
MQKLSEWGMKYLSNLNLPLEIPSYSYLERICHAHLTTIPFENISKPLYFRERHQLGFQIPSFDVFVENYRQFHFGGTCYSINSNLMSLLKEIGFACYHIMLGKEHIGIIVELDGERVYVDCGAAAPFFKPVRFENDLKNVSQFGDDRVQLLPVDRQNDEYKYVRYTQGKQSGSTWGFNSRQACDLRDFSNAIDKSNQPGATFMTILRCQLWQTAKNRSVSLVNNQFSIRYANGNTIKKTLTSVGEIEKIIAEEFLLPKLPVAQAIDILRGLKVDIFNSES